MVEISADKESYYFIFIVGAAALAHFLLVGMARCMGILNLFLLDRYEQSYASTAMVFSIFNATRTLTGACQYSPSPDTVYILPNETW